MAAGQESLLTLQVRQCEVAALNAIALEYKVFLCFQFPNSPEREAMIAALEMIRVRLRPYRQDETLWQWHECCEEIVPLQISTEDLVTFDSAVIGYTEMLKTYGENEISGRILEHVSTFQQRHTTSQRETIAVVSS